MLYILEMNGPHDHPLVMRAGIQGLNRMEETAPRFEPLNCCLLLEYWMKGIYSLVLASPPQTGTLICGGAISGF